MIDSYYHSFRLVIKKDYVLRIYYIINNIKKVVMRLIFDQFHHELCELNARLD